MAEATEMVRFLREFQRDSTCDQEAKTFGAIADELDRLRAVEAERDRLREALEKIATMPHTLDAPIGDEARLDEAARIASRALASTGQQPTPAPTEEPTP